MPVCGEGESLSGSSGTFSQGDMAPVQNVSQAAGADGISTWVALLRLNPTLHGRRQVPIAMSCVKALRPWRSTAFLTAGVTRGTVLVRGL